MKYFLIAGEASGDLHGSNLMKGIYAEDPQAVLIRACVDAPGPGRLTKALGINGALNRGSICGDELWIEDDGQACTVVTDKRVGIGYASQEDQDRLWRFKLK